MRHIARSVISQERPGNDAADTEARAAFRVCAKLRASVSALAGTTGFRSLLTRSLALARKEVPWLAKLAVSPDGGLILPPDLEAQLGQKEAARGGVVVVTHLLELLATFIGEPLTVRLVGEVWPKAALKGSKSGGEKP